MAEDRTQRQLELIEEFTTLAAGGAEAQLWAKERAPKALGHAQREHDPEDIALLRQALAADTHQR